MEDDHKKKWKTTSKKIGRRPQKNGRRPQHFFEDDLQKKIEDEPINQNQPNFHVSRCFMS